MIWTDIGEGAGTNYFVSNTLGNDSNIGSIDRPFKSIAKAISQLTRNGRVYLKRGDTFTEPIIWGRSADSFDRPAGVMAYGSESDPRPTIKVADISGFQSSVPCNNIALVGIDFECVRTKPLDPKGILFNSRMTNVLVEDCRIDNFSNNVTIVLGDLSPANEAVAKLITPSKNIRIRGCVISRSNGNSQFSGQAVYCEYIDGLVVEDCIFYQNGYDRDGSNPSMYRHSFYITAHGTVNTVVRRNWIVKSAGFGVQMRGSGIIDSNILIDCGVPASVGGATGVITNNLILGSHTCVDGDTYQGLSINCLEGHVGGNLICAKLPDGTINPTPKYPNAAIEVNKRGWTPQGNSSLSVVDNMILDWQGGNFQLDSDPWDQITIENLRVFGSTKPAIKLGAKVGTFNTSGIFSDFPGDLSLAQILGPIVGNGLSIIQAVRPTIKMSGTLSDPNLTDHLLGQRKGKWDQKLEALTVLSETTMPNPQIIVPTPLPPVIMPPVVPTTLPQTTSTSDQVQLQAQSALAQIKSLILTNKSPQLATIANQLNHIVTLTEKLK